LDFSLTEEQVLLRQLTERFVAARFPVAERATHQVPDTGHDADNWAQLAELGLLALPFPADLGGLDGGTVEMLVLMEGLGRGLAAEPVLQELYMGALPVARLGGDRMADRIAAVIEGKAHFALAWAEADRRYNVDRPATTAVEQEDGIRLTGTKTFVLAGSDTNGFVVTAASADGVLGLYLVDADAPGLSRTAYRLVDDSCAEELRFDAVPAIALGGGIEALESIADTVRLAASAEALGIMETLFATTLDYVRTRHQFGTPIGRFQVVQHRMADLYATMELARSLLYRGALAEADMRSTAVAAAKCYIGANAVRLAEECVQLHGGMGVSDELIVGHGLKRLLVLSALFGDPDQELARYVALTR